MSVRNILTQGGFTKFPRVPQSTDKCKVVLYYLENPTSEKAKKAKKAILQELGKGGWTYSGDLGSFEQEIKHKNYLLREGKTLQLIEESEIGGKHQITVSNTASYLFKSLVKVGENFNISGSNATVVFNLPSIPQDLPPQNNDSINVKTEHCDFVGREKILDDLETHLINASSPSEKRLHSVVLHGAGGFGKTETAVTFANRYREHFSIVCWIPSSSKQQQEPSYRRLAKNLRIFIDTDQPFERVLEEVHFFLENESLEKPYLLIYDNVDQHINYPQRGNGRLLITTQHPELFTHSEHKILLNPLTVEESQEIFKQILNDQIDPKISQELAKILEGIPLSVNQAAHYIKKISEISPELYLDLIKNKPLEVLKRMKGDEYYPDSLYKVWNITQERLKKSNPIAYEWLEICAYLYNDAISIDYLDTFLEHFKNEKDVTNRTLIRVSILEYLVDLGIFRRDDQANTFSIHRTRQGILKESISSDLPEKEATKLIATIGNAFSENDIHDWIEGESWDPHAKQALATTTPIDPKVKGDILHALGKRAYSSVDFDQALQHWEEAVNLRKKLHKGNGHPDIAQSLNNIGLVLRSLGRDEEARKNYNDAFEMWHRLYKGDHLDIARSLNNLGTAFGNLGRDEEARKNYNDALEMRCRLHKGDHPDIAESLNYLGIAFGNLGRDEEARKNSNDALEMRRRLYKGDHPCIAQSLNYLGVSLGVLGRYEEARKNYNDALEMRCRLHKGDHPDIAQSLNYLGDALGDLRRYEEARKNSNDALEMGRRLYKGDHPDIAQSLNYLGNALGGLRRYEEARKNYNDALEMRCRLHKGDHPHIATYLNNIGVALGGLGRYEEALDNYTKAFEMGRRLYKENHPDTITYLNNMGLTLNRLGRYKEARKNSNDVLEMRACLRKENHFT